MQQRPFFLNHAPLLIKFICICSLLIWNHAFNQTADITGHVIDRRTKKPLHYANVFLSNTTFGTATLHDGSFQITNVPSGTYTLVVSMMGYHMKDMELNPLDRDINNIGFQLDEKVLKGESVSITATDHKAWRSNLKQFKRLFLGESKNAQECEILNEFMLDFHVNSVNGEFQAYGKESVKIKNHALGYQIDFYIQNFVYLENAYLKYEGRQLFKEMEPADEKQKLRWQKNRQKAYHGSLAHFLKSLYLKQISQEGFQIFMDSELPGRNRAVRSDRVDETSIVFDSSFPQLKKISFPQYLKVIYQREIEPYEYRQTSVTDGKQTSWLKMTHGDTTTIHAIGKLSNPFGMQIIGYMAWERFGDKVPLDFQL